VLVIICIFIVLEEIHISETDKKTQGDLLVFREMHIFKAYSYTNRESWSGPFCTLAVLTACHGKLWVTPASTSFALCNIVINQGMCPCSLFGIRNSLLFVSVLKPSSGPRGLSKMAVELPSYCKSFMQIFKIQEFFKLFIMCFFFLSLQKWFTVLGNYVTGSAVLEL
jgi:hypothetical protein